MLLAAAAGPLGVLALIRDHALAAAGVAAPGGGPKEGGRTGEWAGQGGEGGGLRVAP